MGRWTDALKSKNRQGRPTSLSIVQALTCWLYGALADHAYTVLLHVLWLVALDRETAAAVGKEQLLVGYCKRCATETSVASSGVVVATSSTFSLSFLLHILVFASF